MSTITSALGMTEHELGQIARANSTTAAPVVFVHGLWLLPSSWDRSFSALRAGAPVLRNTANWTLSFVRRFT